MSFKKIFLFLFIGTLFIHNSFGQNVNLLNAKKVNDIGKKTKEQIKEDTDSPLEYGYINDRDILWSNIVWEEIDLSQKINFPYYFPIDSSLGAKRLSLYNTFAKGLNNNKFKIYDDSYLIKEKTKAEVDSILSNNCTYNKKVRRITVKPEEITSFSVKGIWYFDKLQGELKYRLLAIAPLISKEAKDKCIELTNKQQARNKKLKYKAPKAEDSKALYWVYYPELRQILHEAKVYNPQNTMRPISFDDMLNARRFSSAIYREENVYGNRNIKDYEKNNSIFQLLEAERIKESIRNKEIDMWNY
jgi:gliding motility associated protien GldN